MQHRKWLVVFAGSCIVYALVFPRFLTWWINYGSADVWAPVLLAITSLVCWTAMEVGAHFTGRRPLRCECGYSLTGVKCPECGQAIGR